MIAPRQSRSRFASPSSLPFPHRLQGRGSRLSLLAACAVAAMAAAAPSDAAGQATPASRGGGALGDEVLVVGSVVERALAEAPYAASVVGAEALRAGGPLVNLSEAMARVPGLVVANRWNYAQDLQISSRGFGARAGFGVRGLRLYSDGIPASGPDGQGQVSHFDLAGAARVEVLRGPFSVLYGNSSGGVVSVVSAPVRATRVEGGLDAGSFGLRQLRVQGESPLGGGLSLRLGAQALSVTGFRPQSEAERKLANLRLAWQDGDDSVVAVANVLDQPADDPLGLDRAQFERDPLSVASVARQFDTRKTTRQSQFGSRWQRRFADGALREASLAGYAGRRQVTQFLAIAPGTQANPRHGGGVIDFERSYQGVEARLRWAWEHVDLTAGVALDRQRDDRQGYENFVGTGASQQLGVRGALRRDEVNRAGSDDAYVQLEWAAAKDWVLSGGLRGGRVSLSAQDRYLVNGDDGGARRFDYANPVLGLRWQVAPGLNLHAALARGFESPTLGELAYRRDGTGGFNIDLKPQRSRQAELGAKWRAAALAVDATLFEVRVADEIGVATNASGRSSFQNVGATLRKGAELSARWRPSGALGATLAATWLDATYRDAFLVCAGLPCTAPTAPVTPGNRIAGTSKGSVFAELSWRTPGFGELALELRQQGNVMVNDRNSEAAPGHALAGLRWLHRLQVAGGWQAELLVRVDNVADVRYAGSVIVNDANGRFYETGAPRAWLVALRVGGW